MADKKTFTIEINGIEKAYDNTIKLRDALKSIEDKKIVIDDEKVVKAYESIETLQKALQAIQDTEIEIGSDEVELAYKRVFDLCRSIQELNYLDLSFGQRFSNVISDVRQTIDSLMYSNTSLSESFQNLGTIISDNTTDTCENNITIISSISALREELTRLENEYEALDIIEREGQGGKQRLTQIGNIELALASATRTQNEYTERVRQAIAISMEEVGSITQLGLQIDILSEQYRNLSEADRTSAEGEAKLALIREYQLAMTEATQAQSDYNRETQDQIALASQTEGSIANQQILLGQLETQYRKMSKAERESSEGKELAKKIRELRKEITDLNTQMLAEEKHLSLFQISLDAVDQGFKNAKGTIGALSETLGKASEALNFFGIESETLNNTIAELNKVTETINALQAVHTGLVAKDSIVMKAASFVQKLYALSVGTSSIAMGTFATALAATGIGAIIILLGLLIVNFDKIVEVVAKVIDSFGGLQGIMDSMKIEFERIKKLITEALLLPLKQVKNAIDGVKKAFEAFKNSDGFFDGIKNAWKSTKETLDEAQNIVKETQKNIQQINEETAQKHLENEAKIKERFIKDQEEKLGAEWKYSKEGQKAYKEMFEAKLKLYKKDSKEYKDILNTRSNYEKMVVVKDTAAYIKEQEEKQGANWKFTEDGIKKYKEYFDLQLLMYEKDSADYKRVQQEKSDFDAALLKSKETNGSNNGCGSSGAKSNKEKQKEREQEEKDYRASLKSMKDATQEYQNQTLEKEIEFNRKMVEAKSESKITESQKLEIENLKKSLDERISAQKKAAEEEIKGIKDKKAAKEKAAAAEIALEQAKLDAEKQIAKAQIDITNNVLNTRKKAVSDLESIHLKEKELLDSKLKDELTAIEKEHKDLEDKYKGHTSRLQEINIEYQNQKTALDAQHKAIRDALQEKQNEEATGVENKVKETEAEAYIQRIDLDEKFLASKQEVTNKLKEDKIERDALGLIDVKATKENYQEAIKADREYLEELKKNKDTKLEYLDEQIKASEGDAEQQAVYLGLKADTLKNFEAESAKTQARIKENTEKETGILASKYDELYNKIKEKWDKINSVMTTVGTALTSALKGQLEELQKKQEEITKQYDEAVEKHKASQEKLKSLEEEAKTATGGRAMVVQEQIARQMEANDELAKQEKDLAKQKEKAEKEKAKKEKQQKKVELAQKLITTISDTATGVAKAVSASPMTFGLPWSAFVATTGAIQTATIAKQMSKLEDGGMLSGKRHSQGGMRIEGTNIEVEGDEYVVNRISTRKNLGLINYINKNRKELKAEDISSYFARSGRGQQEIAIPTKQIYEQGGMLTNLEVVDSIGLPDNNRILEAISQINFKPIVSVVDITSAQNTLSEVKDIAGA